MDRVDVVRREYDVGILLWKRDAAARHRGFEVMTYLPRGHLTLPPPSLFGICFTSVVEGALAKKEIVTPEL